MFADEIVPVSIPAAQGDPIEFTEDEGVRASTSADSLAWLRPAFPRTARSPPATLSRSPTALRLWS